MPTYTIQINNNDKAYKELLGILQNYCRCGNKNIVSLLIKYVFLLMLVRILLWMPCQASAEMGENSTILANNYIEKAKALKLAQQPAWLNLLHYKIDVWGHQQSQADDVRFFMAGAGATDAKAELEANLRGFFSGDEQQSQSHAQCRFPARLHWLNQQLGFADHLPKISCEKFAEWKQQWQATQITLLFPSMYLGNPASMFGHTFIRFDSEAKSQLLSPTLSYAASPDVTDSLLVFSWKGMTGGYPGHFTMQPYYETLQEYSDIEQRDIWEYQLNLTQAETDQLIRHLWEVSDINFDYFFLRENCSFRLLALLDVARPGINMSLNTHPVYAIPVDTVRDIQRAGLIGEKKYRPSRHNKILQMSQQVDSASRELALSIVNNELAVSELPASLTIQQQAHALELADEILNQDKTNPHQALQLQVLSERSLLHTTDSVNDFYFDAVAPEASHESSRWHIAFGEQENLSFYEIGLRANFHDTLDPVAGFPSGVAINFLDTQFRWYEDQQQLKFESVDIFSMQSIVSVEKWSAPVSSKLSFQVNNRNIGSGKNNYIFETTAAIGFAKKLKDILFYAMLNGRLDYSGTLENRHTSYIGTDLGYLWSFKLLNIKVQNQLMIQHYQQVTGDAGDIQLATFGLQFDVAKNHALRFSYEQAEMLSFVENEWKLGYLRYF